MEMDFVGVVIEESLENKNVLKKLEVLKTKIEPVTEEHKTSWLKQWTLHTVRIPEHKSEEIAERISESLDSVHNWYADFKNDRIHYIIFRNKIFKVDRAHKGQYEEATKYGISLGIPEYQVDFSPNIKEWKRKSSS